MQWNECDHAVMVQIRSTREGVMQEEEGAAIEEIVGQVIEGGER